MDDSVLDAEARPARNPGWTVCESGGDLVLVSYAKALTYRLNPSAAAVLELCDGKRTLREIAGTLETDVGAAPGALRVVVTRTVDSLAEAGLLSWAAGSPASNALDEGMTAQTAPWDEIARPRNDLSDIRAALALFRSRHGDRRLKPRVVEALNPTYSICDGQVAVRYCFPDGLRSLPNAPLDHPSIALADQRLACWPLGAELVKALVHSFHPLTDPNCPIDDSVTPTMSFCHSSDRPEEFGAVTSTINHSFLLAENLVHEAAHQKLFALGVRKIECDGLVANAPEERFKSPVVKDRDRPMTALVHGVYSYMYVTAFDVAFLENGPPELRELALERLRANVGRIVEGGDEMRAHRKVDAHGARFFADFDAWLDELIETGTKRIAASADV